MEEELNENDLEERFYSMLHHVDQTQYVKSSQDVLSLVENAPRSTLRRYWRTSADSTNPTHQNIYQKSNTPKETPPKLNNDNTKPKEEKQEIPEPPPAQLSLFMSPIPQKNSIEIIEHDVNTNIVELESSDEDEVVEVALPPKPTITIESSDDEVTVNNKKAVKQNFKQEKTSGNDSRESSSPVPSVVSSVSDEFIRSDCIALNISSHRPDKHSFDFSLHGADLLGQNTPSKKKKKKKATSTPTAVESSSENLQKPLSNFDTCFATPKSKAKNKKVRNIYAVSDKSIPNADVYDSDSNQSIINLNKVRRYAVNEKSVPSIDVYESDSNQSGKDPTLQRAENVNYIDSSDSSEIPQKVNKPKRSSTSNIDTTIVDLTDNALADTETTIQESIVMGNVTGFTECDDYETVQAPTPIQIPNGVKLGSTKVPAILFENLDFDNLKGKNQVCKNRRYSLTTLRQEMEKFYNESWGGENFNHREIQKYMSRDKSLWAIDPKDKMQTYSKNRKPTCNYCNRTGHRDDSCRFRPMVCYMCGRAGHSESRCPQKICVRCAAPSRLYTAGCESCAFWNRITCAECGQHGHPRSHCPDMWRRYHNTIELTDHLEENHFTKKPYQLYCSGCTRRGHLVHTCRVSLPFSGLPIHSPYVHTYQPIYTPPQPTTPRTHANKRQSKSPTAHETHLNKRRNTGPDDSQGMGFFQRKSPAPQSKLSLSKESPETPKTPFEKSEHISTTENSVSEAPDFIPIGPSNRDSKGQVIQDNEVSDTSDVITSARIYITNDIIDKLKTKEGEEWLKEMTSKHNVTVEKTDLTSFLSIKGKIVDQEAFQSALRDWNRNRSSRDNAKSDNEMDLTQESENDHSFASDDIPRNRMNLLRKIGKALDALKTDLGEPNQLYKELTFLQNRHQQMTKQKVINPKQLNNNRDNINDMLKKLNMILLGQAGLANGSNHVNELYAIQAKLKSFRQKHVPDDLRSEIGQHYHTIFTAVPRDDYNQLIETFYVTKTQTSKKKKKKKKKSFNINPKMKMFKPIPSLHKPETNSQPVLEPTKKYKVTKNDSKNMNQENWKAARKPLVEKTINKLVFYHRRILRTRPNDSVLRKTKVELVRKLHSHIASLGSSPNMSSKSLKKMKKIQERAQTFLNIV